MTQRRGYRVTGLDISPGVLAEARRKADHGGLAVTWVAGDARDFSFPEPFDAALCLCEGSCGLLGSTDDPIGQPQAILSNVGHALQSGAPCLFTVLNAFARARRAPIEIP